MSGLNMNIDEIAKCLEATFSSNNEVRKSAEQYLNNLEKDDSFSTLIFDILSGKYALEIKIAAGTTFKNFIKRNWIVDENNDDKINETQRNYVKAHIIQLMLMSEPLVEKQLSEAVAIIGKQDFPERWPTMLPQLVAKISEGNFVSINVVLRTCHSLFKRYRKDSRSDSLWLGIKEVIDKLAVPLTHLVQHTLSLIGQYGNDKGALAVLWSSMLLITKIFRSLNSQDLPEYFEDNMRVWMVQLHAVLQSADNGDTNNSDDEPTIIDSVKTQICRVVSLYATKYSEEFADYLREFIVAVYQIMLTTSSARRHDSLVTAALDFLTIVASRRQPRVMFDSVVNMEQLCRQIILPNIEFQLSDQETFEDSPEEYMGRDMEGSNAHTRRKSSCELIKSLNSNGDSGKVVMDMGQYIEQLLANYGLQPTNNWKMKDSALFLVTVLASKGETDRSGVTMASELIDVRSFYQRHILPELHTLEGHIVIKADAIKYLVTFRSLLGHDELRVAINLVVKFVTSRSQVVHSYAAAAINKLLMVREASHSPLAAIKATDLTNAGELVASLCATMDTEGSQDNVYVMQALTRTLSTLHSLALPHLNSLVPVLIAKLTVVVKNPQKPLFNHFLIESLALAIKLYCGANPAAVTHFESALLPIFNEVLRTDIVEFVPYVFQMFSLLLDQQTEVRGQYTDLFPFLMLPPLWDNSGNIPSLIRLLISYLEKTSSLINHDNLNSMVKIFTTLNNSRALDSFGFALMAAVLHYVPREHTGGHMVTILTAIFQRLSKNKTAKYLRGLVIFLAHMMHVYPTNHIVALINGIQSNLFTMVLDSVLVATMTQTTDTSDKKIVAIAMTKLVTETTEITHGSYVHYWPIIVTKITELLSNYDHQSMTNQDSEAHFVDVTDRNVTSLNQLIFVGKKIVDPTVAMADPRVFLVQALRSMPQHIHCLNETVQQSLATFGRI